MKILVATITFALSTYASAASHTTSQNTIVASASQHTDHTVQIRRTMRMRALKLDEFSSVLSLRQPSTYKLFKMLNKEDQRQVLNAFNSGTNVTQLKTYIQSL